MFKNKSKKRFRTIGSTKTSIHWMENLLGLEKKNQLIKNTLF
jgi:hypothetical protein